MTPEEQEAVTMIGELLNNYSELYHEEADYDYERYGQELDALSFEELQEEYRTHFLNE